MRVGSSVLPIDQPLEDAARNRPGEPIRVRLQPTILHVTNEKRTSYHAWKRLHFNLEFVDVPEGRAFREALSAFFYVMQQKGIGTVHETLMALVTAPDPVATPSEPVVESASLTDLETV